MLLYKKCGKSEKVTGNMEGTVFRTAHCIGQIYCSPLGYYMDFAGQVITKEDEDESYQQYQRKSIMPPFMFSLSKEDGDVASCWQSVESNSISNQKALILNFLKDKKDIVVVSVRVDDGYSRF